jgi:type VI secretion system protein ImpL
MQKIPSLFKQRWLVTLLGVVALSLFIWFLGPLFAVANYAPFEDELNRFIALGVVVLIWMSSRIFAFFKTRKKNDTVMAGMVAASAEPALSFTEKATRDELQTLKERMEDALAELKKTRLGGASGRQFLYQLPWYIIIGPPGSGKTTLLQNSQIRFPLADRFGNEAFRGVGGTRNCDWWFAENAVLLDTAGRYTTQDSDEEIDRGAWLGFLALLKKHRSRRPINGAIIAVSIAKLLESNEAERRAHANAIRKRIHELHETLGIRLPIYLMLTKCDLLAGFMDYFDNLDRDTRAQVWGMTFPLSEDPDANPIALFEKEFELLHQSLQGQLIDKLEHEQNGERCDRIYTFPQQFATLKPVLLKFAEDLFEPTRYQQQAMLRGLYFTSATQEGSPIDRIMSSLAENFGVERQALLGASGSGKSFFINRLMVDVIFGESSLAGANIKLERKRAWLQRGAVLTTAAMSAVIVLAWVVSYARNKVYIDEVKAEAVVIERMAGELPSEQADVLTTLALLDRARALRGGYADQRRGTPWSMTYGLYQGDKLGKAGDITYRRLLKQAFLPRLMARLEEQIGDNATTDYLFEALKVYLMLDDSQHYDTATIRAWITLDWDHNLPDYVTHQQRANLADHLEALLETGLSPLPRPLDPALVDNARAILSRAPLVDRVYGRLKLELADSDLPDFRISEAAGREAPLVFARNSNAALNAGIPGLFTYDG